MESTSQNDIMFTMVGKAHFVPLRSFVEAAHGVLDALTAIDRSVSGCDDGSLDWEITQATTNSPLTIVLHPTPKVVGDFSGQVIGTYLDGLEQLVRSQDLPRFFTFEALRAVRRVVRLYDNGLARITFTAVGRRVSPSRSIAQNIDAIVEDVPPKKEVRKDYFEKGSIEGKVETVSCHTGYYFNLWEILNNVRVRCTFAPELREIVRSSWEKRSRVYGRIRYAPDGIPKSIDVERIDLARDRKELPQFNTHGIDITGGVESAEYIRGLRDAD